MKLQYYKETLENGCVFFTSGLLQNEIQQIEQEYDFRFSPDLREFLMFVLPISKGFINWRKSNREQILEILSWLYEGICLNIEYNAFWLEAWGQRLISLEDAFKISGKAVEDAPTLIPIYEHRYIPDNPVERGNPIFSVYQTDIIYYGSDLADYLENEFRYYFGRKAYSLIGDIKPIEFWSQLVE